MAAALDLAAAVASKIIPLDDQRLSAAVAAAAVAADLAAGLVEEAA